MGHAVEDNNGTSNELSSIKVGAPAVHPFEGIDGFFDARPSPTVAAANTFRTLALTVDRLLAESALRSVAVVSAHAGDGRSLTAELLARALSEIRPPVRLLDADPFNRSISGHRNGRSAQHGGRSARRAGVARSNQTLALDEYEEGHENWGARPYGRIALGQETFATQTEFLGTVQAYLANATDSRSTVVIDVPACDASNVPFAIAEMADSVLYVARTGMETSSVHAEIRAQFDLLGVNILGVVFNER